MKAQPRSVTNGACGDDFSAAPLPFDERTTLHHRVTAFWFHYQVSYFIHCIRKKSMALRRRFGATRAPQDGTRVARSIYTPTTLIFSHVISGACLYT